MGLGHGRSLGRDGASAHGVRIGRHTPVAVGAVFVHIRRQSEDMSADETARHTAHGRCMRRSLVGGCWRLNPVPRDTSLDRGDRRYLLSDIPMTTSDTNLRNNRDKKTKHFSSFSFSLSLVLIHSVQVHGAVHRPRTRLRLSPVQPPAALRHSAADRRQPCSSAALLQQQFSSVRLDRPTPERASERSAKVCRLPDGEFVNKTI